MSVTHDRVCAAACNFLNDSPRHLRLQHVLYEAALRFVDVVILLAHCRDRKREIDSGVDQAGAKCLCIHPEVFLHMPSVCLSVCLPVCLSVCLTDPSHSGAKIAEKQHFKQHFPMLGVPFIVPSRITAITNCQKVLQWEGAF